MLSLKAQRFLIKEKINELHITKNNIQVKYKKLSSYQSSEKIDLFFHCLIENINIEIELCEEKLEDYNKYYL